MTFLEVMEETFRDQFPDATPESIADIKREMLLSYGQMVTSELEPHQIDIVREGIIDSALECENMTTDEIEAKLDKIYRANTIRN